LRNIKQMQAALFVPSACFETQCQVSDRFTTPHFTY